MSRRQIRDPERAIDAMIFVGTPLLMLGLLEEGQDVFEPPALAALAPPTVEVLGLAADIDHSVDRSGATQNFAARLEEPSIVQLRLGLAVVAPVDAGIGV